MDPSSDQKEEQVLFDFPPFIRIFSSGRVHRFIGTSIVPPSTDPAGPVLSRDVTIDPDTDVSARLYIPNLNSTSPHTTRLPILIYYHGGGFCTESPFSPAYHTFVTSIVSRAPILAVSVDYRLAPEHKLPAAYEDSLAALRWVVSGHDDWIANYGDVRKIFVAGDSAGANLAHHVAVHSASSGGSMKVKGMALIHPYFGEGKADKGGGEAWKMLSETDADDLRHYPMANGGMGMKGLAGVERVMVCVAELDFFKGRGVEYFEMLKGLMSGGEWRGELEFVEDEGEGHVYHLSKPGCEKGVELEEKLVAFINKE